MDPDQLKRQGTPDQFIRMTSKNKIENFFVGEYIDIVESQLKANNGDDFQTDEILTKHIKVKMISILCYFNSFIGML